MKKLLCIAFASALLGTGYAQAADLPLADGHVLPLDASISVHQGKDSYFGKKFNTTFASSEIEKRMLESIKQNETLKDFPDSDQKLIAKEIICLLQNAQIGQIVSDTGDHVYQAFTLSIPMTKESFTNWGTIASKLFPKEKQAPLCQSDQLWPTYMALLSSPINSQGSRENAILELGDGLGKIFLSESQWKHNHSHAGVPYMQYSIFLTPEQDELVNPLYIAAFITPSKNKICMTLLMTSAQDGYYFQPYILQAMEDLR